jgi:hypothetical protein
VANNYVRQTSFETKSLRAQEAPFILSNLKKTLEQKTSHKQAPPLIIQHPQDFNLEIIDLRRFLGRTCFSRVPDPVERIASSQSKDHRSDHSASRRQDRHKIDVLFNFRVHLQRLPTIHAKTLSSPSTTRNFLQSAPRCASSIAAMHVRNINTTCACFLANCEISRVCEIAVEKPWGHLLKRCKACVTIVGAIIALESLVYREPWLLTEGMASAPVKEAWELEGSKNSDGKGSASKSSSDQEDATLDGVTTEERKRMREEAEEAIMKWWRLIKEEQDDAK